MNVKFCLAFPCEAVSVPVMRRVLGDTLRNLGVVDECIGDILVAVTEACTNVLRHGGSARRYEVVTSVGPSGCLVEVVDFGQGFSASRGHRRPRAPTAPRGGRAARAGIVRGPPAARIPARAKAPALGTSDPVQRPGRRGPAKNRRRSPRIRLREPGAPPQRRGAFAADGGPPVRSGAAAPRVDDRVIARLPESGRGLQIMRAMVDDVTLQSGPGRGTVVSMRKQVSWRQDAPLAGLSGRKLRDAG